jgi:hypothetical protein
VRARLGRRGAPVDDLVGAGVQAVRDNLCFPAAPIGGHLLVLTLHAGPGCLLVLVTNLLPNRRDRAGEADPELRDRIEGNDQREPVPIPSAVS